MEEREKQNKEIHSKINLRIRYSGIFVAKFCMLARGEKKKLNGNILSQIP
jgi:hypothetical protein